MRITEFPFLYDLKTEYPQLRREGCSREEAVKTLMERYNTELTIGAEDDGLLFWVGLADAQYQLKELSEEVAGKALEALDRIQETDWDVCKGDLERRRKKYAQAPMPERKVGKPRPPFSCGWEIGDTYAYQMKGPEAEQMGISGKYMLFRMLGKNVFEKAEIPLVTVTFWEKKPFPTTAEEFTSKPILRLAQSSYRFEDKPRYIYKTYIDITCKQVLNRLNLEYVGNFPGASTPEDEVKPLPGVPNGRNLIIIGTEAFVMPSMIDHQLGLFWERNDYYSTQERGEKTTRKYVILR